MVRDQSLSSESAAVSTAPGEKEATVALANSVLLQRMTSVSVFGNALEAQHFLRIIDKRDFAVVWEEETINPEMLAQLSLSSCRVTSISPLFNVGLQRLTSLNLSFNRIADISHLSHLGALRTLDISHNRIVSIDALRKMSLLTILRCHNNMIESLEPLLSAPLLNELWLSDNKVDWLELIYLLPLINLNHLVKFNNPAEAKSKVDQFIWATCAALQTLDGADYQTSAIGLSAPLDASPLDFLHTTDGKVMIAQAKSQLTPALRAQLQPFVERINMYVDKEYAQQLEGHAYHERQPRQRHGQGQGHSRRHASPSPIRHTQDDSSSSGGGGGGMRAKGEERRLGFQRVRPARVKIYKAKVSGPPLTVGTVQQPLPPRGFIPDVPMAALQSSLSDPALTLPPQYTSFEQPPAPDSPRSPPKQQHQHHQQEPSPPRLALDEHNTGYAPGACIVRFGEGQDAPVALCLQGEQGNGYARWSKGGPVACSYENGRIFSSYRGGAIAVVLDKDGNGSVMNPRGKCVCLLNGTNGSAKIMDKAGNVLSEHRQHSSGSDGAYKWTFDGLHVEFLPSTWEILVRLSNERVACEFSSVHGGKLITDKWEEKKERERERQRAARESGEEPSGVDTNHEVLRSGLASITSGLDSMMDGLRAREPLPPKGKKQSAPHRGVAAKTKAFKYKL